jgi:hypothetical protein
MRKLVAVLLAGCIAAALVAVPASAAKKKGKHVHGTFGATLAPFPKLAAWGDQVGLTKPGCSAGEQDVHWVAMEFTAPGKGNLRLYSEGFTGDHDLYVFQEDLVLGRSEGAQYDGTAPPEEEITVALKPKQTVTLVACNWLGHPEVEAHYEGLFK